MHRNEEDLKRLPPEDSIRSVPPTLRVFVSAIRACRVPPAEVVSHFLWSHDEKINVGRDRPTWTSITRACTKFVKANHEQLRTLPLFPPPAVEAGNG